MQVTATVVELILRSLPQPFARETNSEESTIDGALFAFVSLFGTDPEAFLLLEARQVGDELS